MTARWVSQAGRLHDRPLLLILSEPSISREWVNTEIARARKREVREGKRAREIREYFVPHFSNWKDHDSYQAAFGRLVSDLKAEASK